MKRINKLFLVLTAFLVTQVCAQTSATVMLEQSANQILNILKQNQSKLKNNPAIIHQAIRQYLLPNVDVVGMSRSVLGRQAWTKASADEKKAFTDAFTKLVIRTYANPLSEYSGETIRFSPMHGGDAHAHFTHVNSLITRPNGRTIPLNYSLVSKQGTWKIYDLSVEGVSLIQSFRSQFSAALQTSSIQALVSQMNHKQKAG